MRRRARNQFLCWAACYSLKAGAKVERGDRGANVEQHEGSWINTDGIDVACVCQARERHLVMAKVRKGVVIGHTETECVQ